MSGGLKEEKEVIKKENPCQEVVEKLWADFLVEYKDKADPFFLSYASTTKPEWREPNIVFFSLKSNIAQGAMRNNRQQFIPYLQERMHVQGLTFECEVEMNEEMMHTPKAETVVDRLIEIKEKNQAIDLLITSLDLDFFQA